MLALLGAHRILHISRIRVNVVVYKCFVNTFLSGPVICDLPLRQNLVNVDTKTKNTFPLAYQQTITNVSRCQNIYFYCGFKNNLRFHIWCLKSRVLSL